MNVFSFELCFVFTIIATTDCSFSKFQTFFNDNLIPFVIGASLFGFFVIIISLSLLVWCLMRKNENDIRCKYTAIEDRPESIKLVNFAAKQLSAFESKCAFEKVDERPNILKVDSDKLGRHSVVDTRPKAVRRRRASVPAALSVLLEASPSLEESSRKISLSYNCVMEPINDPRKSKVQLQNEESVPESEYGTEILSCMESTEAIYDKRESRYSVYDDESLALDNFSSKYGKIVFSLQYNLDAKTLEVTIKNAQYLSGQRIKGKNRFYIKMRIKNASSNDFVSTNSLSGIPEKGVIKPNKNLKGTFRTSIKSDFCNPKFEESFKFTSITPEILKECVLQFIIKEETPKFLERNRVIGQVIFILEDAKLIEKHELISEIVRDIQPVGLVHDKGQAVISLFYCPSGILSVSILEIFPGRDPVIDMSAEICLRSIDNIIHYMKFEIEEDLKSKEVVQFKVDKCLMNSVCLVIMFYSRIRNCSKTPYGRIVIGPIRFSDGPGLTHWGDMSLSEKLVVKSHEII